MKNTDRIKFPNGFDVGGVLNFQCITIYHQKLTLWDFLNNLKENVKKLVDISLVHVTMEWKYSNIFKLKEKI